MAIYTNVKSVMSIIDTTITNVNIIPNGRGVRKIRCETVKKFQRGFTFLDTASINIKSESENADVSNIDSNIKDVRKKCFINSKKSNIRYRNRIIGAQNQQRHSSVYEQFSFKDRIACLILVTTLKIKESIIYFAITL